MIPWYFYLRLSYRENLIQYLYAGADSDAHIDLFYLTFMSNQCCSPSHLLKLFIWCFSQMHPISHWPSAYFTLLSFSLHLFLCPSLGGIRKLKLENELTAQLWRVHWEDIQMSNMEKVLRRACSKLTISMVRGNTHTHTHTHTYTPCHFQ